MEALLESYGVTAIFLILLVKSIGVPVPVPADVIMLLAATRAAEGKLAVGPAFAAMLLAFVVGGLAQFWLARGPAREALYRYGGYLGMPPARLDSAAANVGKAGPGGISLALLAPGVRAATVVACGLAEVPLRTFSLGLVLGSLAFVALHFGIGYFAGPLVGQLTGPVPMPLLLAAGAVLLLAGGAIWLVIRRRRSPLLTTPQLIAEAAGAWHEATCPACLALATLNPR